MKSVTPFLTFKGNAEEAVNFYVSVIKNSRILHVTRYPDGAPSPKGSVMTIRFSLNGEEFIALNANADWKFSQAMSLVICCDNQDEIDQYWQKLPAGGGQAIQCGWLQDRFGIYWQVNPKELWSMIEDKDEARAARVLQAVWSMTKLDVAALKRAYEQG